MVYTKVIGCDVTYHPLDTIVTLDKIIYTKRERKVVEFDITGVKKISSPFILMQNGDLYFYGEYDSYKQYLCDDKYEDYDEEYPPYPIKVKEYSNVQDIYCWDDFFIIVLQDGTVKINLDPINYDNEEEEMIHIDFPEICGEQIISATTNSMQFLFLSTSGNVYTMGKILDGDPDENENYMFFHHLGIDTDTIYEPTKIEGLQNITYMYINEYTAFFMDKNGIIYGCGRNNHGIIDPYNKQLHSITLRSLPYLKDIIQVAVGGSEFSLFLNKNGTILYNGNLMSEDVVYQKIPNVKDVIYISCSYGYYIYITENRYIYHTGKTHKGKKITHDT